MSPEYIEKFNESIERILKEEPGFLSCFLGSDLNEYDDRFKKLISKCMEKIYGLSKGEWMDIISVEYMSFSKIFYMIEPIDFNKRIEIWRNPNIASEISHKIRKVYIPEEVPFKKYVKDSDNSIEMIFPPGERYQYMDFLKPGLFSIKLIYYSHSDKKHSSFDKETHTIFISAKIRIFFEEIIKSICAEKNHSTRNAINLIKDKLRSAYIELNESDPVKKELDKLWASIKEGLKDFIKLTNKEDILGFLFHCSKMTTFMSIKEELSNNNGSERWNKKTATLIVPVYFGKQPVGSVVFGNAEDILNESRPLLESASLSLLSMIYSYDISSLEKCIFLSSFIPLSTVREIISQRQLPEIIDFDKKVVILMADIRKYSHIVGLIFKSDILVRDQLKIIFKEFMNEFRTEMGKIIYNHGGFVDKFVGDEVVAIFSEESKVPGIYKKRRHSSLAEEVISCGIEMQIKLANLNYKSWTKRINELKHSDYKWREALEKPAINSIERLDNIKWEMGMGIGFGTEMTGVFGCETKYEYTVMGEGINRLSRIVSEARNGELILIDSKLLKSNNNMIKEEERKILLQSPTLRIFMPGEDEERSFNLELLGKFRLKGFKGRQEIYYIKEFHDILNSNYYENEEEISSRSKKEWHKTFFNHSYYSDFDPLLGIKNTKNEVNAIINQFLNVEEKERISILDLCCGYGRHLTKFMEEGFMSLTGVDISSKQIKKANKKANNKIEYIKKDARIINFKNKYDMVFILGSSLGLYSEEEPDELILAKAKDALKKGGMILIEQYNIAPTNLYIKEVGHSKIEFERKAAFNENRIFAGYCSYFDVRTKKRDVSWFRSKMYTQHEFKKMLEKVGFSNLEFYGDFNFHPYNEKISPLILVTATK